MDDPATQLEATDGGFQHDGGGRGLVFAVKPTKVLVFSKGSLSHTRYLAGDR